MNKTVDAKLSLAINIKRHLIDTGQRRCHRPKVMKCVGIRSIESKIDDPHWPPKPNKRLSREVLRSERLQCNRIGFVRLAAPHDNSHHDRWAIWHRRHMLINRPSKFIVSPSA